MFDFDPAIHERNGGYYLAHVWEALRLIFVFAFLTGAYPFRALWDGRRDIDASVSLRWLAAFVVGVLALLLAGLDLALDGDPRLLLGTAYLYSGVCLFAGVIGVCIILWRETDQMVFIDP